MTQQPSPSTGTELKRFPHQYTICINCDRSSYVPESMISDPLNNVFCSPNCGWSFHLRYQDELARTATAAAGPAAAHMAVAAIRTSLRRQRIMKTANGTRKAASEDGAPSARKPPRHHRARSDAKRAANVSLETGNAMFNLVEDSNWWF